MASTFGKDDQIKVFAALVQNAKLARRRRTGACALLLAASLPLAGCETATSIMGKQGTGVAEVAHQSPQEAASNLASLTDVIQRNPASAEAYNTRGVAYARIGKFQEAIADFGQSIKLAPGNAASLTNRALAYRQINRDDAALADFNGAVSADPSHAPAYLGRANLLRVQGKLD
ncbi:MAG TPA: tetratricopeptide repeat protein, partial [Methylocella sp.]|nr:tetratricopeptide repeat protein [Methylocella sp.]